MCRVTSGSTLEPSEKKSTPRNVSIEKVTNGLVTRVSISGGFKNIGQSSSPISLNEEAINKWRSFTCNLRILEKGMSLNFIAPTLSMVNSIAKL